jgi:hypothetical protein
MRQFSLGLERAPKFGDSLARYQSKWRAMGHLSRTSLFEKRALRAIGDKKAGGVSLTYEQKPKETLKFLGDAGDVVLLHVVRNPIDTALSLLRSHSDEFSSFSQACTVIARRHVAAIELAESSGARCYRVHYEELVQQPIGCLRAILGFLRLSVNEEWLRLMADTVSPARGRGECDPTYYQVAETHFRTPCVRNVFARYL